MNCSLNSDRKNGRPSFVAQARAGQLPVPVYHEFVAMLFSMRLPIVGMGLVFVAVAALIAREWQDGVLAGLATLAALVTMLRLAVISAYKKASPIADDSAVRAWEQLYAMGSYAFALLLGIFNIRVLTYDQPLLHLLSVSMLFGFGAGLVSRISIRPMICIASLLLATIPTIGAILMRAVTSDTLPLHTELYAVEGFLILMITALSLQTVAHLYRSAVVHQTTEHDMAQLAKRDALTGLANRLLLRDRFQAAGSSSRLALHFVDLDGFKPVNDTHGHPAGDAVLKEVARRLGETVRATDTVARLGGDEFVVLQPSIVQDSEAELIARRIIRRLSAPYEVDGKSVSISASIGIATSCGNASDLDLLLSRADEALYRAKTSGRNGFDFWIEPADGDDRQAA